MRKVIILGLLLAGAAAGGFAWWKGTRPPPEVPGRALFEQAIPEWLSERSGSTSEFTLARAPMLDAATPFPTIRERLEAIDKAYPDIAKVREQVSGLNRAAREAGLPYWVDVQAWRKRPLLLTYELAGRSQWELGKKQLEVLRVRRLDRLNVEMGLTGHAGSDQPVVLVDRLESLIMDETLAAFAEPPPGNGVDRNARQLWRKLVEAYPGGAPLADAAAQLRRRDELFASMRSRLRDGRVQMLKPEAFVFGTAWFKDLEPYTSTRRAGGPLILAADLRDLRRADAALAGGKGRQALEAALELEARAVEAHEARHALDPEPLEPPRRLVELVGDDDPDFARAAERELRAYFGEVHDMRGPACLGVLRIGTHVAGKAARATPHYFAGRAMFEALSADGEADIAASMARLCALPDEELRKNVAAAYERLYGAPFAAAKCLQGP